MKGKNPTPWFQLNDKNQMCFPLHFLPIAESFACISKLKIKLLASVGDVRNSKPYANMKPLALRSPYMVMGEHAQVDLERYPRSPQNMFDLGG